MKIINIIPLLNLLELVSSDGKIFYYKPMKSVRSYQIGEIVLKF